MFNWHVHFYLAECENTDESHASPPEERRRPPAGSSGTRTRRGRYASMCHRESGRVLTADIVEQRPGCASIWTVWHVVCDAWLFRGCIDAAIKRERQRSGIMFTDQGERACVHLTVSIPVHGILFIVLRDLQLHAAASPNEHQQISWRNSCYCPGVRGSFCIHVRNVLLAKAAINRFALGQNLHCTNGLLRCPDDALFHV